MKFLIKIEGGGFCMDDDNWGVSVYIDGKSLVRYGKEDCVRDDKGNWYVCISKDVMRKFGNLSLVADAEIPDADFDDGIRHEVDKVAVGTYRRM